MFSRSLMFITTILLIVAGLRWLSLLSRSNSMPLLVEWLPTSNSHQFQGDGSSNVTTTATTWIHKSNQGGNDILGLEASPRRRLSAENDEFLQTTRHRHLPLFEASKTFRAIGPTVFPRPTYMYTNNKDDQIKTNLKPIVGKHRPNHDAVLVFCAEYPFETFLLFLWTLYQTGYTGDVVIGISKMDWDDSSIRDLLQYWQTNDDNEMNVVVYVVPYHCYDLEGRAHPSHRGGMRVCQCHNMFGRLKGDGTLTPLLDERHGRTAQTIRYELYWIWAMEYDALSWILLIDARDTIFQTPPFDRVLRRTSIGDGNNNSGGTLIFFGENVDATSLGKSKYNRRWLTLAYGEIVANEFRDKPILCSGSTMGEQSAVETYLRAQVAESDESKTVIFGADQGFHNYLYYSNKLVNAVAIQQILVQDQGLGLVNNMGALRDKPLVEWGNGKIVAKNATHITIHNWDGTLSPIVHQYDRHKELSDWWHKKKYMEYKKEWDQKKKNKK